MDVDPGSYWAPYFTYFPLIERHLPAESGSGDGLRRACVIGASDGKFALPLVRAGWQVVALETDELFLDGGVLELTASTHVIRGLRQRLEEEGLGDRCTIVEADYMVFADDRGFDFVMGSGLWSMPQNRHHDLPALIQGAADLVAPGGVLLVEYLIGLTKEDLASGYYPDATTMEGIVERDGWQILENADLGIHGESHVGLEEWHEHRYGAIVAQRTAASVGVDVR